VLGWRGKGVPVGSLLGLGRTYLTVDRIVGVDLTLLPYTACSRCSTGISVMTDGERDGRGKRQRRRGGVLEGRGSFDCSHS